MPLTEDEILKLKKNIKILTSKQVCLLKYVNDICTKLKKKDEPDFDISDVTMLTQCLDSNKTKYEEIIDEIQQLELEIDINHSVDHKSYSEYLAVHSYILSVIDEITGKERTVVSKPRVKLPPLDIPYFSGDILEWNIFYESFKASIHDNPELGKEHKVQYLVSRLKGKALAVCSGIPALACNYDILWSNLKERYEDKRALASEYLRNIYSFPPIKPDDKEQLNNLIDKFIACTSALTALKVENLGDFILCNIASSKIPYSMLRHFESSLGCDEMPNIAMFTSFLKEQARVLTHMDNPLSQTSKKEVKAPPTGTVPSYSRQTPAGYGKRNVSHNFMIKSNEPLCSLCKKPAHALYRCDKFKSLSAYDRLKFVRENSLCFNCLGKDHTVSECKSKLGCSFCRAKHHSLLHLERHESKSQTYPVLSPPTPSSSTSAVPPGPQSQSENRCSVICCSTERPDMHQTVLLATAQVNIIDKFGYAHTCRMLIDSCSQSSILTESCCKKLNLSIDKTPSSVRGIGESSSPVLGQTHFTFVSRTDTKVKFSTRALVVNKITDNLPTCKVNSDGLKHLVKLPLADESYYVEGPIDGLLGTDIYTSIIEEGKVTGAPGTPVAFNTKLGYIVMGSVLTEMSAPVQAQPICAFVQPTIEHMFERFIDLEEVPVPHMSKLTEEETQCEEIYKSTVSRDDSGRYSVSLCFKQNPDDFLGNSWNMASKRFLSLEKKLNQDPELKLEYSAIIEDYLKQGFVSLLGTDNPNLGYYIPHRAVVKRDRVSTKVRIVHDASAPSSTGYSLNDCLHVGPNLYANLLTILLKFRLGPIAVCADVTKMFLMIHVIEAHRKYLKFLWRSSPEEPIGTYQMNRVCFGVRSSPYLSLRTLRQLAFDERDNFPIASARVSEDFFMDDFTSSVMNEQEAEILYSEMVGLFRVGGFSLVKWQTNSKELLDKIPLDQRLDKLVEWDNEDTYSHSKVLGLKWNSKEDKFLFEISSQLIQECKVTKRGILSTICKLWDPLGLVSPAVIYAKLLVKELWELQLSWDERPPDHVVTRWFTFLEELPKLNSLSVPRHIAVSNDVKLTIIGFADSSEKAMGAVVYSRVEYPDDSVRCTLLCSKSKVAPKKYVSIPRLELSAAVLLSKLVSCVVKTYEPRFPVSNVFCFTDSTVALAWIHSNPCKYKTFVANRIQQIHDHISPQTFYHVPGADNPADCITRGLLPAELCNFHLWLSGPCFLLQPTSNWQLKSYDNQHADDADVLEQKLHTLVLTTPANNPFLILARKHSCLDKLLRAIVYVLRFTGKLPREERISTADMEVAESTLLKSVQQENFPDEFRSIERREPCSPSVRKLKPFVLDGVLRVGGRLGKSNLGFETQHPALLPKKHHVTNLIIDNVHRKNLHTGPHLLLAILRQRYWILAARSVVRQRVQACNVCFRHNPAPVYPLMADLPDFRVTQSKVFYKTGCDYMGPFNVSLSRHRGVSTTKAYVCLFICLTTKAIHLELASDLSTPTFLNALKRFLARRSACKFLLSDCGTNFVGAKNALNEVYRLLQSREYKDELNTVLLNAKITWSFNCPAAPHHGGIWEGNVRPVKTHLMKVIGTQILTFEQFSTVIAQVECLSNSKPLCPLSSDPSDPSVLTPAHFLHAEPISVLPAADVSQTPLNHLSRYELLDNLVQNYWKRWSTEYLNTLQTREKWNIPGGKPLVPGMVVILKRDNCPPLHWPVGVIDKVHPGSDSVTRVVDVRTKAGVFRRPATKVCPLPTQ
uniref:CCHC-type domain-containing protein n=1 Tax=Cacopsylla melanoneura TaxID=428564 RepID=A0A8D8MGU8_9HEMI